MQAMFKAMLAHPKARRLHDHEWEVVRDRDNSSRLSLQASIDAEGTPRYALMRSTSAGEKTTALTFDEVAAALTKGKPWLSEIARAREGLEGIVEDPDAKTERFILESVSFAKITVSVIYESIDEQTATLTTPFQLLLKDPQGHPKRRYFPLSAHILAQAIARGDSLIAEGMRAHPEVADALLSQEASVFSGHEANQLRQLLPTASASLATPKSRL